MADTSLVQVVQDHYDLVRKVLIQVGEDPTKDGLDRLAGIIDAQFNGLFATIEQVALVLDKERGVESPPVG